MTSIGMGLMGGATSAAQGQVDNPLLKAGIGVASGMAQQRAMQYMMGGNSPPPTHEQPQPEPQPTPPVQQETPPPVTVTPPVQQETPPVVTPPPKRNDTWVGPDAKPRGGDTWTQNALPPMGGLPTPQGPYVPPSNEPLPSISPDTMLGLDMVNAAASSVIGLPTPIGVGISAANNAAHIYNEGMTQRNAIEVGSTALNCVPALAPFNAVRGLYDGVCTVTGNGDYSSTALADRGLTAMTNHVNNSNLSTGEIDRLVSTSFG
jgi:hypothetical protein